MNVHLSFRGLALEKAERGAGGRSAAVARVEIVTRNTKSILDAFVKLYHGGRMSQM